MFFIGFTGPLLTLILSVILPLFFLTAKHYKEIHIFHESEKKTIYISENNNHSFLFTDFDNLTTYEKNIIINKQLFLKFYLKKIPKKLILQEVNKKPISYYNNSGNKAPPLFL